MAESTLKEILKRRSDDTIRRIQQRREWAQRDRPGFPWGRVLLYLFLILLLALAGFVWSRALKAEKLLAGAALDKPVQVYAQPLELKPGMLFAPADLERELRRLGYRENPELSQPGTFVLAANEVSFVTRPFRFADGARESTRVVAAFDGGRLAQLRTGSATADALRLEPMLIGSLLPDLGLAETIVVRPGDIPRGARELLPSIADPGYVMRAGLDYGALLAAFSGGEQRSLTQQLVRSLNREGRGFLLRYEEAVMAATLEWRLPPERLLEAWVNVVHLGQDGARAVRGVGLASYYWFRKAVPELEVHELALLGAMALDPGNTDPRKHPEAALVARDRALDAAATLGLLSTAQVEAAKAAPLGVVPQAPQGASYHPGFMALVRQHLIQDYGEGELARTGLRVYTTFDPLVQELAELAVSSATRTLEQAHGIEADKLEAATVVVGLRSGEVQALVGGRDARSGGLNRAMDRVRPVGTLVQPAAWYTALMDARHRYSWLKQVEDAPFSIQLPDGRAWSPRSADDQYRGRVTLWEAGVNAYELPVVRIGMDLGVPDVLATMQRLGFSRVVTANPSVLQGALAMTPLEVAQQYHTLAAGGQRIRLTAVREVGFEDGTVLPRKAERRQDRAIDPRGAYLVQRALVEAARRGAARELAARLPGLAVAAQVGSTEDRADSWVAGFTGDRVVVTWTGRDDGQPTGLTGASGGIKVWAPLVGALGAESLALAPPEGVQLRWIDAGTGTPTAAGCAGGAEVPFLAGQAPAPAAECAGTLRQRAARALRQGVN